MSQEKRRDQRLQQPEPGTGRTVVIESKTSEVEVTSLDGKIHCKTDGSICILNDIRNEEILLSVSKEGYKNRIVQLEKDKIKLDIPPLERKMCRVSIETKKRGGMVPIEGSVIKWERTIVCTTPYCDKKLLPCKVSRISITNPNGYCPVKALINPSIKKKFTVPLQSRANVDNNCPTETVKL